VKLGQGVESCFSHKKTVEPAWPTRRFHYSFSVVGATGFEPATT
jgi:hypothetical protein